MWKLKFVTRGENISEQNHAQFQLEPRPTRKDFFLHIIERQHLWYNHTTNPNEELNDYDPPADALEESPKEGSPVTSVDESP